MKQLFILMLIFVEINVNAQNSSPYWSLAGNSNATSSSKLGTTNNISLRFYTNNSQRMIINSAAGFVGIGTTTPTERLHINGASGANALRVQVNGSTKLLVHQGGGVSIGTSAIPPVNGLYVAGTVSMGGDINIPGNINVGGSRFISSVGTDNNFFGTSAGNTSASGAANTAIGSNSLISNTSGFWNVASGAYAAQSNSTAAGNTALGYSALRFNTTGQVNVAVGGLALYQVNGSSNTAIGYDAGLIPTSLSQCTMVGAESSVSNGHTNATALGYSASATASNQVMLGNTSVTSVVAAGSYYLYSDGRFKTDIRSDVPGLAFINALKPVTYHYNIHGLNAHFKSGEANSVRPGENTHSVQADAATKEKDEEAIKLKEQKLYTGFVAQDVEQAAKKLSYEFSGLYLPANDKDVYALSYADFVVPLVKAVQELSKKNEDLITDNEQLKEQNKEILQRLDKLEYAVAANGKSYPALSPGYSYLEQNMPNPSLHATTIPYHLSLNSSNAKIIITDIKGSMIKSISLGNNINGQIYLNDGSLSAGIYDYSLFVNNKKIDSKQLIISK